MKRFVAFNMLALVAILAACVTINVYFPAAAAEKAADRTIDKVFGPGAAPAAPATAPAQAPPPSSRIDATSGRALYAMLDRVLRSTVPAAEAQAINDLKSSPVTRQLEDSMAARNAQLSKYYDSGAVGFTADGMIELRDATAVPLAERNPARKAVEDENKDRAALYAEYAKANDHPEWESQIRSTFAKRWIAKAKSGWYVNDGSGWKKK
jgi:uncharacterized protein